MMTERTINYDSVSDTLYVSFAPSERATGIELNDHILLRINKVLVTFENGTKKEIDLEPYLRGPIFELIRKDLAVFRAMKVQGNTIAWDNGADIDPDVLYYGLKPAWMEEAEMAQASGKS